MDKIVASVFNTSSFFMKMHTHLMRFIKHIFVGNWRKGKRSSIRDKGENKVVLFGALRSPF